MYLPTGLLTSGTHCQMHALITAKYVWDRQIIILVFLVSVCVTRVCFALISVHIFDFAKVYRKL